MAETILELEGICPLTTAEALRRAAVLVPDLEAVVAPDGRATFGQVAEEVAHIRAALKAARIDRGDRVAICMGNSRLWVSLFLAIGSVGAVAVPVNTRLLRAEIADILQQSRVSALFVVERLLKIDFAEMLTELCPELPGGRASAELQDLRTVVMVGQAARLPGAITWAEFMTRARDPVPPDCCADDTLLIQFTSGTTSAPKGAMLTHRSMLANGFFAGVRMGVRAGDRFHSARPFFHVVGTSQSIILSLQHLVTLVTMERFEPGEALRLMEEERCTHFSGNDTMALMLLNHPDRASRQLCLRGAWLAGSPTVVSRIMDDLGVKETVTAYGLSEAAPNVTLSAWWEPIDVRAEARMRPQPGVAVRIRSADSGRICAPGEVGEIQVRGWNVTQGYFGKPEETRAAIDADGWLSTGDLGRLGEDGRLQFAGRAKDIIRVGGENVAPAEIENILHRHPGIRMAQIVGVPDRRLIEVPAAFVILNGPGGALTPDDIIAWCKENMAGFKVPRFVEIVPDFESIGMTASSKVQKRKLAAYAVSRFGLDGSPAAR
jgi:fatty-acyl-CoA synthase